MIVTGYKLRAAIRAQEQARDTAAQLFADALYAFRDEDKTSPVVLALEFREAEEKIAQLQAIQMRYNLAVSVMADGDDMPLALAVKLVGGAGRMEAMWKSALPTQDRGGWLGRITSRAADDEVARRTVSTPDLIEYLSIARKRADSIRNAIGVGNAVELDMDVDPSLFG